MPGARPSVTASADTATSAMSPGLSPLARTRNTGGSRPISPKYEPRER